MDFENNRRNEEVLSLPKKIISGILLTFLVMTGQLSAQSISEINRFRIDNKVKMEKDDTLITVETSTIFCDGNIFDFIGNNGEIIIYRQETDSFTILDPIHRIQTKLTNSEIDDFIERITEKLKEKDDKFCNFMIVPVFDCSKNDSGELLFQSKWIDYRIKTLAFDELLHANDYFLFIDAYTRLNIYLNPGTITSFARININEYLKQEKCFPEKFSITVFPKGKIFFGKTIKIESEHKLIRRLTEEDQGKILRALHFEQKFPKTTIGNYQKVIGQK